MANLYIKISVVTVVLVATLYQVALKDIIWKTAGFGRHVDNIDAFNVRCQKIHSIAEACEDLWLHEPTGYLYMACSDSVTRVQWLPS
jgi:hypothetical protein